MIVAFAVAALVVYEVRRLSIDNAHTIAIIAGGTIEAIVMLVCVYIMEIEGTFKLWMIVTFTVVSIILTLIIKVFIISVDYSGTEYAQFEDDDYYYYVKAIPKMRAGGAKPVRYYDDSSRQNGTGTPVNGQDVDGVDFKTKLEDSLKDL